MLLQLTDGATTISLSGSAPVLGCTYFPTAPERRAGVATEGAGADVTETAEVTLRGTAAAVRDRVNSIERLLDVAAVRQQDAAAPRSFILYRPVDSDAIYRSEVVAGRVVWSDHPGLRRLGEPTPTVKVAVIWTRRAYWEGPETTLPTVTIDNGPNGNTVTWNTVVGSAPAPVRLTLTNASGVTVAPTRWFVGNDAFDLLGAGGNFVTPIDGWVQWSTPQNHAAPLWRAPVASLGGADYRVLAAWVGVLTDMYLRANIATTYLGPYLTLQRGLEVLVGGAAGTALLDLGTLTILPPGDLGSGGAGYITLTAYTPYISSSHLRWFHLTPANNVLTLHQVGYTVQDGHSVVYDGIDDVAYAVFGPARHPVIQPEGTLLLYPGQPNRVRVLLDEGATFNPARLITVSGVYRPRRFTV